MSDVLDASMPEAVARLRQPKPALHASFVGTGWDAVETRRRIERGDVPAHEVIEGAIARAEEAFHLGAVFARTYDRARAAANTLAADAPFAGVPTFTKDNTQLCGVPTTWGSSAVGSYVSSATDPIASQLERIGVVSLGKSACPEFGLTGTTEPVGFLPCRNPWDPSRSTGGSSGGAAALVAAGVVPIAHANDGGGSIRIPAACCGLVGMKPSRFRLDVKGSDRLPINFACEGILTRSVRDTVAFFTAIESKRRQPKVPPIGEVAAVRLAPLRIGFFVDAPLGTVVDPEVREAVFAAAKSCEALGHHVEEVRNPVSPSLVDDFLHYWGFLAWLQVGMLRMRHSSFDRSKLEPWTRGLVHRFGKAKLAGIAATWRLYRAARQISDVMGRHDVLVSPTVATPAPPLGHLKPDAPFATHYERITAFAPFTAIHNVCGAPAISLPLGRSRDGLPIGVQFGAAHGKDRLLLELALSLEAAAPWDQVAPRARWARAQSADHN
jgi:amidase